MEEQRRVQEAEIGRGTGNEGAQQSVPTNPAPTSNTLGQFFFFTLILVDKKVLLRIREPVAMTWMSLD